MIGFRFIKSFIVLFSIYAVSPLFASFSLNEDLHIGRNHLESRYNRGIFVVDLFFSRLIGGFEDADGEPVGKQILKKKRSIPVKISKDYGADKTKHWDNQAFLPRSVSIPIRIALFFIDSSGTRAAPDSGYSLIFSGLSPPLA